MGKIPFYKKIDFHSSIVVLVILGTVVGAYFGYMALSKPNDAFSTDNGTSTIPTGEVYVPEGDYYGEPGGMESSEETYTNTEGIIEPTETNPVSEE
ncbi:hypothetical protein KKH43_00065 [Patescibacteria group bacterium]|nr:hypothetical protein [Patescibacteria group bacterium]